MKMQDILGIHTTAGENTERGNRAVREGRYLEALGFYGHAWGSYALVIALAKLYPHDEGLDRLSLESQTNIVDIKKKVECIGSSQDTLLMD